MTLPLPKVAEFWSEGNCDFSEWEDETTIVILNASGIRERYHFVPVMAESGMAGTWEPAGEVL